MLFRSLTAEETNMFHGKNSSEFESNMDRVHNLLSHYSLTFEQAQLMVVYDVCRPDLRYQEATYDKTVHERSYSNSGFQIGRFRRPNSVLTNKFRGYTWLYLEGPCMGTEVLKRDMPKKPAPVAPVETVAVMEDAEPVQVVIETVEAAIEAAFEDVVDTTETAEEAVQDVEDAETEEDTEYRNWFEAYPVDEARLLDRKDMWNCAGLLYRRQDEGTKERIDNLDIFGLSREQATILVALGLNPVDMTLSPITCDSCLVPFKVTAYGLSRTGWHIARRECPVCGSEHWIYISGSFRNCYVPDADIGRITEDDLDDDVEEQVRDMQDEYPELSREQCLALLDYDVDVFDLELAPDTCEDCGTELEEDDCEMAPACGWTIRRLTCPDCEEAVWVYAEGPFEGYLVPEEDMP